MQSVYRELEIHDSLSKVVLRLCVTFSFWMCTRCGLKVDGYTSCTCVELDLKLHLSMDMDFLATLLISFLILWMYRWHGKFKTLISWSTNHHRTLAMWTVVSKSQHTKWTFIGSTCTYLAWCSDLHLLTQQFHLMLLWYSLPASFALSFLSRVARERHSSSY